MSALQDKFEYKWIVAVTFVLGLFLEIMDTMSKNLKGALFPNIGS
jgi:hypothetical protein